MAAGYGLKADDWQADPVCCIYARRKSGRWASATTKITVSRQNGKNGILEVVELFGMAVVGLKFLHTAHEVKTARKAFRRLLGFFENEREFPELAAMVVEIRKTNGQEAIFLSNGGSIEFIARSSGSGRGFTVDVLVCDEDQDLTDDELAALLPTISAAPSGNPMVILTGTPPDPEKLDAAKGEVARRVRREGLERTDPNLTCFDWGVPDGPLPDVDDRKIWHSTNPALGGRLNIAELERERKMMSPEKFARERLGWWGDPDSATGTAFGEGRWEACLTKDLTIDRPDAIGLGGSMDRNRASIGAVAGGEILDVGAVDQRDGVGWLVPEAKRLQDKYGCAVALDERGPIADLIPALQAAGVDLTILKTSDVLDATASLFDRVSERRLRHGGHEWLDQAVKSAKKRNVGDRWTWGRRQSSADISMLEAILCATHAVEDAANYDVQDSFL
jgi:Phage terminase-like protein, large subunit